MKTKKSNSLGFAIDVYGLNQIVCILYASIFPSENGHIILLWWQS